MKKYKVFLKSKDLLTRQDETILLLCLDRSEIPLLLQGNGVLLGTSVLDLSGIDHIAIICAKETAEIQAAITGIAATLGEEG